MTRTGLRPSRRVALTATLLLALAGCGGGGGGGEAPDLKLQFASDQISARYFHGQKTLVNTYRDISAVGVSGTVDPVPDGPVYVRVVFDAPVFESDVGFDTAPPNQFSFWFKPVVDLPAGTYAGSITVQAFQDQALKEPFHVTGGTLHYTLTVDPELTVTVKIDGVTQSEVFTSSHYAVADYNDLGYGTIYWYGPTPAASWTLRPGQVVELEASVPVTWHGPDQTGGPYGSWFDAPTKTETTLRQTIPNLQGGVRGLNGSSFLAMPLDGAGQFGAGFVFDISP